MFDHFPQAPLVEAPGELTRTLLSDCASADHEGAAKALTKGLAAHSENRPGYLIHTSGTGILTFADYERKTFGEAANKVYDDWDGVKEVTSLPDFAFHRNIDKIVLEAGTTNPNNIKTAIVCPPTIYGTGRGPGNQRSIQLPDLAKATLTEKKGFKVGEGLTYWANVHVFDLSKLYLKLLEAAASGGGKATWGKDGYYFTEHGEHIWGEISQAVASAAHKQGFLPDDEVISISPEKSTEFHRAGPVLWGANSRGRAIRARKLLGWSPQEASIAKEAPIAVAIEAKSLGLVEGHAAKVAG